MPLLYQCTCLSEDVILFQITKLNVPYRHFLLNACCNKFTSLNIIKLSLKQACVQAPSEVVVRAAVVLQLACV